MIMDTADRRQLMDENYVFQYEKLRQIIDKPELHDVPIVIYSISGPLRTGKSYLLNAFWHLLQNRTANPDQEEDRNAEIVQVFQSSKQVKPLTKGIFMTTNHVLLETPNCKIAVFLMDVQGLDGGDRNKCKEAEIFAITSVLSFMQIVNVKGRLTWKDVDTYAALAFCAEQLEGIQHQTEIGSKKLQVVIRDWEHEEYNYGFEGGKMYCQTLGEEPDFANLLASIDSLFPSFDCYLMPSPGKIVKRQDSKRIGDMKNETWHKMIELQQSLFSPGNIEHAACVAPKGRYFLRLAKKLSETLLEISTQNTLQTPLQGFYHRGLQYKVESYFQSYKDKMKMDKNLTGNELQDKHKAAESSTIESFRLSLLSQDVNEYANELKQKIETEYQIYKGGHLIKDLSGEWLTEIQQKGNLQLTEVRDFFRAEGNRYREIIQREITDEEAQKVVIEKFNTLLSEVFDQEISRRDRNGRILVILITTAYGLGFGVGAGGLTPAILTSASVGSLAFYVSKCLRDKDWDMKDMLVDTRESLMVSVGRLNSNMQSLIKLLFSCVNFTPPANLVA